MSHSVNDCPAIPGLTEVPRQEMTKSCCELAPAAVQSAADASDGNSGIVNADVFWQSMTEELPNLARLSRYYMNAVTNSANAERSFSLYNLVFSERRRSLSASNLKALVMLYHNLGVDCGAFNYCRLKLLELLLWPCAFVVVF